ncbi:MAG: response regulator [Oculatellaceae cyanobacterium Prado106]|jgi:DNA-binding response OmpR family regulator|nr:response regulator [Oculatellaceae cyanobacterium Prado106]
MNAPTPRANLLLVDDTPNNLRLLSAMLTEQGYEVRRVINGAMALKTAQANPPDLILLDIRMPDMNGYEVCQHLKADAQTQDIPVIFISALDEVIDKVKAFAVGGMDYITKPFSEEEVFARVENTLTIRKLQQQLKLQQAALKQEQRDRHHLETQFHHLEQQYHQLLNHSTYGTFQLRRSDSLVLQLNSYLAKILGYESVAAVMEKKRLLDDLVEGDRNFLNAAIEEGRSIRNHPIQFHRQDGEPLSGYLTLNVQDSWVEGIFIDNGLG